MVEDNWAIDYHNRIVTLFNQNDKEGARRLLDEALRNLPDSRILKDDKRRLGF
jgi:DNA-binding GntR family transcriptional regulator